jgi:hypothetical protein
VVVVMGVGAAVIVTKTKIIIWSGVFMLHIEQNINFLLFQIKILCKSWIISKKYSWLLTYYDHFILFIQVVISLLYKLRIMLWIYMGKSLIREAIRNLCSTQHAPNIMTTKKSSIKNINLPSHMAIICNLTLNVTKRRAKHDFQHRQYDQNWMVAVAFSTRTSL